MNKKQDEFLGILEFLKLELLLEFLGKRSNIDKYKNKNRPNHHRYSANNFTLGH